MKQNHKSYFRIAKNTLVLGYFALAILLMIRDGVNSEPLVQTLMIMSFMGFAYQFYQENDNTSLYKKQLIKKLTNQVNDVAKSAISELNDNGWLADGSLNGLDLRGANWKGATIRAESANHAHIGASLRNVNLKQATLQGVFAEEADLHGANLHLTDLRGAKLSYANLNFADLTLANLSGTNLYKTSIVGANFAGVTCDEKTILPNGDKWFPDLDWGKFYAIEQDNIHLPKPKTHLISGSDLLWLESESDGDISYSHVGGQFRNATYGDFIIYEAGQDKLYFTIIQAKYEPNNPDMWSGIIKIVNPSELPD